MIKGILKLLAFLVVCWLGITFFSRYQDQITGVIGSIKELIWSGEPETEPLTNEELAEVTVPETESETEPLTETSGHTEEVTEVSAEVVLPEQYDLREVGKAPRVKNQGSLETCWAVAATSGMESVLLPEEPTTFSPDHISLQNPYQMQQEEGGNYNMTMAYLTGWLGPVTEEQDAYGDGVSPDDLTPVKHVQEMQMIDERDHRALKELVYQYGAVQSSFYMDMDNHQYSSIYYNEFESAYCYNGESDPNHDVLIIGWDDNYPAENFTVDTGGDGAFICQNSWGTDFGQEGIFYVSYEDVWVGSHCISYTGIEEAENYDRLYQSDLCGWVGQLGYGQDTCYFANVYESSDRELIEAVGFYATGKDTSYTIYKTMDFQRPLSIMNRQKIQSGTLKNAGFYTIPLKETIEVEAGQRFALIIRIETPGVEYPAASEYRANEITEHVTIDDGEGYISADGYRWERTETKYECNLCLKVYTNAVTDSVVDEAG